MTCLGVNVTFSVSCVVLVAVKKTWHIGSDSWKNQHTILQCLGPPMKLVWCDMTLVLGVANGFLLILNPQNRYACADNCGFTHEACNKLSVELDWSKIRFHSVSVKSGPQDAKPSLKRFLVVWLASLARFSLWICGVISCILFSSFTLLILILMMHHYQWHKYWVAFNRDLTSHLNFYMLWWLLHRVGFLMVFK